MPSATWRTVLTEGYPGGRLILDGAGNLYGTTDQAVA